MHIWVTWPQSVKKLQLPNIDHILKYVWCTYIGFKASMLIVWLVVCNPSPTLFHISCDIFIWISNIWQDALHLKGTVMQLIHYIQVELLLISHITGNRISGSPDLKCIKSWSKHKHLADILKWILRAIQFVPHFTRSLTSKRWHSFS